MYRIVEKKNLAQHWSIVKYIPDSIFSLIANRTALVHRYE